MTGFVPPHAQPPTGSQSSDDSGLPDPSAIPVWHFSQQIQDGLVPGPITHDQMLCLIRGGSISPITLVWREGMLQWTSIKDVPELVPAISPSSAVQLSHSSVTQRNARINCITMFVIFCACAVTVWVPGCWAVTIAAGVFAAIYVPLRWRVIKALPNPVRTLGLIGGFGLIAMIVMIVLSILGMILFLTFYAR